MNVVVEVGHPGLEGLVGVQIVVILGLAQARAAGLVAIVGAGPAGALGREVGMENVAGGTVGPGDEGNKLVAAGVGLAAAAADALADTEDGIADDVSTGGAEQQQAPGVVMAASRWPPGPPRPMPTTVTPAAAASSTARLQEPQSTMMGRPLGGSVPAVWRRGSASEPM